MNTATKRGMSETKMTLLGKREKVFTQAGTDEPRTTLGYNPQKYLTKTLFLALNKMQSGHTRVSEVFVKSGSL